MICITMSSLDSFEIKTVKKTANAVAHGRACKDLGSFYGSLYSHCQREAQKKNFY